MSNIKFSEVFEEFLIYSEKRHKRQGFETIIRNFKLHILPYFNDKLICNLNKLDIINWQNIIIEKNFSNSFNNSLYSAFSSFINYCVLCDYLEYNIVLQVGNFKRKIEDRHHNIYSLSQFRIFRRNLDNNIYKQYFNFLYFYGTRPSEALAIRFSDIDGKYLSISHNLLRRGNRELDTPKNQSSIRTLKLDLVTRLRFWYLKCYYEKHYGSDLDLFVFGGIKPLSTSTLDRHKKKACLKANLFEITTHEFRHSYCSRMIHKKKPIDFVSKSMGHSKVSTTLDVYLQLEHEKRASNTLFSRVNFFSFFIRTLKKLAQSIITLFV